MKIKQVATFFPLWFLISTLTCFGQESKRSFDEKEAIQMVTNFYTENLTLHSTQDSLSFSNNLELFKECTLEFRRIKQKYCTNRLMDFIDMLGVQGRLDWDPFLEAQDYHPDWIKKMVVKKETEGVNIYSFSRWNTYEDRYDEIIKLKVVKEGEVYKIDELPNLLKGIQYNQDDTDAINLLTNFYTEYLTFYLMQDSLYYISMDWYEISKLERTKLLQKFCTQRLLDFIETHQYYGMDPFLEAFSRTPDLIKCWIKKMIIQKEILGNNIFSFARWNPFEERYDAIIKLKMVKEGEVYKIDELPNLLFQIQWSQ
jgi:hypothetical protein